jgi:hypothetical protein
LERGSKLSSSAKREFKYDSAGVNPLRKFDVSSTFSPVISLQNKLQMVVTLYKDSRQATGYQNKNSCIKLKVVKHDPIVGTDVHLTVASHTISLHELAPRSGDPEVTHAAIGHEMTLPLDNLPKSSLKAIVSLTPIVADIDDRAGNVESVSNVR